MAQGTWQTTAEEDAAILALTGEATSAFVTRHLRHQLDFALSQVKEERKRLVDIVSAEDSAAIDAILDKYKPAKA